MPAPSVLRVGYATATVTASAQLMPTSASVGAPTGARKEPQMALKTGLAKRSRTVGYTSHAAQRRIYQRVKKILDRRDDAVERARRAARRLNG